MGFMEAYKMAIKSILSKKGRSILTMLGVIIGVCAVIAAVAYAQGTTKNITDSISSMGANLIQINITGRGSNRQVNYEQLRTLSQKNSDIISGIAPQLSSSGTTVKKGSLSMQTTTMLGTSPEYEKINSRPVSTGRFLMDSDIDNRSKVAVIGTAVVNTLFPGEDPFGQKIKINGTIFTVIGVLSELQSGQTNTQDDYIIIPITVAQRLGRNTAIRNFSVQAVDAEDVAAAVEKLDVFLMDIYKSENAYRVTNSEQMLETLSEVTGTMMAMLGGIAAISLVVGGIGIMNIMLVSVTERTREIGIRKAIGAKRKKIMVQFLIEAIMITGLGGLLGVLLGAGVIKFIFGGFNLVPEAYSPFWMITSFGISLVVGVVFGMFPAVKAANLNPIEALRFE
ncbi:MAG: putative ABC transport system permease protein [Bacteroidetes bacterium]|nr:MAG: putative ABC transport system permease protein [Bacteroidota bacterium]